MSIDLLTEANALSERLIGLRRDIHAHPELGRQETRTQELVKRTLLSIGIDDVRDCAGTGVCATLRGAYEGPMIALRADMDALPIRETTQLPYCSVNDGVMHACGHDIHTAALLGAAMLLKAHAGELRGSVRFLFQPDEEGDGGAARMIEDGALEGVTAVFGAHTAPELKCGTVGVRYGNAYAASNPFDITIRGRNSHGAEPHNGCDAIVAAAHVVTALQSIVSRNTSPLDSAVLSIGAFHAGTARNIVADEARLNGVIRCFGNDARTAMIDRVRAVTEGVCAAMGTQCELRVVWGYSGIINHDRETALAEKTFSELLSAGNVIREQVPSMTTEDFGAFLERVPGTYWHIGVGGDYPLHNPNYAPDERSVIIAAAAHAALVFAASDI